MLLCVAADAFVLHPEGGAGLVHNTDLVLEQLLIVVLLAAGSTSVVVTAAVAAGAGGSCCCWQAEVVWRQQVLSHGLGDVEALQVGLAGDHAAVPVVGHVCACECDSGQHGETAAAV